MTEEQWTAMKDRMAKAAQRHQENLEVLDERYKRFTIQLGP
jgi:hypothetical protein